MRAGWFQSKSRLSRDLAQINILSWESCPNGTKDARPSNRLALAASFEELLTSAALCTRIACTGSRDSNWIQHHACVVVTANILCDLLVLATTPGHRPCEDGVPDVLQAGVQVARSDAGQSDLIPGLAIEARCSSPVQVRTSFADVEHLPPLVQVEHR